MDAIWTPLENAWSLQCQKDTAKHAPNFFWHDTYITFSANVVDEEFLIYQVALKKPKEHDILLDDKWLMVVVGRMKKQREKLEGVKIFRDSKVIFAKMGSIPTFYFLMLRERHGQI